MLFTLFHSSIISFDCSYSLFFSIKPSIPFGLLSLVMSPVSQSYSASLSALYQKITKLSSALADLIFG
jgi:hypothetical protein